MNILPSQYLDPAKGGKAPTSVDDFIGGAKEAAAALKALVERSESNHGIPIAVFYTGTPGIGKSALALYLRHLLKVDRFSVYKQSGANITVDVMREWQHTTRLAHSDMFGSYRLFEICEVDAIKSIEAQVLALDFIDEMGPRNAIICTSNCNLSNLEERFQSRFSFTEIRKPTDDEIVDLLMRWPIPKVIAKAIAVTACGNVRLACKEATDWLLSVPTKMAA